MRQTGVQFTVSKASIKDILDLQSAWMEKETVLGMITSSAPSLANYKNAFVVKPKGRDEIIGYAEVKINNHKKYDSAELGLFVVRRDYWRRRIGNKLLGRVNAYLIEKGVRFAKLKSSLMGIPFYVKTNWKPLKNSEFHYAWAPRKKAARKRRIV